MKTYRQSGEVLTREVPTGETYTVDIPVVIGNIIAVPVSTALEGELCALQAMGTFELDKATDTEHGDITFGDTLYWDATSKVLTKNPEAGPRFGVAIQDAAAATTVVEAFLDPLGAGGSSGTGPEGVVELTAPTGGVTAGQFVEVGGIHGWVLNDAAQTEAMYVQTRGVGDIDKTVADANGVLSEGDAVYWDAGNAVITKDDDTGSNALVGHAVGATLQADTKGRIRLYG